MTDDLDTLRRRHAALCERINEEIGLSLTYCGNRRDTAERNRLWARIEEIEEREREEAESA